MFFGLTVSGFGVYLEGIEVYLMHEPDWKGVKMSHDNTDGEFGAEVALKRGQQFKFKILGLTEEEAREVHGARERAKINNTLRFDYDHKDSSFWLLSEIHPFVNNKGWNRNSVYSPK